MLTAVNARRPGSRERALAWLAHPLTAGALVLLVVNDHVLKAVRPGWVTGKLSDAAGLVLAPALFGVLLRVVWPRIPDRALAVVALAVTGTAFALVKSDEYAAEL